MFVPMNASVSRFGWFLWRLFTGTPGRYPSGLRIRRLPLWISSSLPASVCFLFGGSFVSGLPSLLFSIFMSAPVLYSCSAVLGLVGVLRPPLSCLLSSGERILEYCLGLAFLVSDLGRYSSFLMRVLEWWSSSGEFLFGLDDLLREERPLSLLGLPTPPRVSLE